MKTFLIKAFTIIIFLFCITACTQQNSEQQASDMDNPQDFPYQLSAPDDKYMLPSELEEVSGLAYLKDGVLAAVQDEKATIYLYDTKNTSVIDRIKFGKSGDYEDLALKKDTVFVLRSDGQLTKVSLNGATAQAEVINTPLSARNDVEGLAYDPENERLLLACKGFSGIAADDPANRAIFAFDLKTNKLDTAPAFLIPVSEVKKLAENKANFRPSGIAIHPVSGLIYVVASVGKVLIVLNKNGSIEAVQPLPARYFRQPEGICFAPNGDMFISNEGKGNMASILRYNFAP
jgi:uncharacterized protein YjiK